MDLPCFVKLQYLALQTLEYNEGLYIYMYHTHGNKHWAVVYLRRFLLLQAHGSIVMFIFADKSKKLGQN